MVDRKDEMDTMPQALDAASDPAFSAWFEGSVVRDDAIPVIAWRGEHGPATRGFSTKLGSLSFGTRETACLYACSPNDSRMSVVAPRVTPCMLRIRRPVMNDPDDPFMDLTHLVRALGRDAALAIALEHADRISSTGHWDETYADEWDADVAGMLKAHPARLDDLYLVAHAVMDDHRACALLRRAGYDGAVCGGWGENACEPEWRVIDPEDVVPAMTWWRHVPDTRIAA